jgi:hypothetical protein
MRCPSTSAYSTPNQRLLQISFPPHYAAEMPILNGQMIRAYPCYWLVGPIELPRSTERSPTMLGFPRILNILYSVHQLPRNKDLSGEHLWVRTNHQAMLLPENSQHLSLVSMSFTHEYKVKQLEPVIGTQTYRNVSFDPIPLSTEQRSICNLLQFQAYRQFSSPTTANVVADTLKPVSGN